MSHIINKLLGREDESGSNSHSSKTETSTSSSTGEKIVRQNSSGAQTSEPRTVQYEGVNIKSTVSSDASSTVSMVNQKRLNDLISKLGLYFSFNSSFSHRKIFSFRFNT
jgi:hypothetical protein